MQEQLIKNKLRLRDLILFRKGLWSLAWFIGMAASISAIVLLSLSGWFITAAAAAGIVSLATAYTFNYLLPAGFVRFTAILRTAGRYGERLASHFAVLTLLADLRQAFFGKIVKNQTSYASSIKQMHRLTADIDRLDLLPVKFLLPWFWSLSLFGIILLIISLSTSFLTAFFVAIPLSVAAIIIPAFACLHNIGITKYQNELDEKRRNAILAPLSALTSLLQWGQWQNFADNFYKLDKKSVENSLEQQKSSGLTILLQQIFLAISFATLLICGVIHLDRQEISAALLLALLLSLYAYAETALALGAQINAYGLSCSAKNRLNNVLPTDLEKNTSQKIPEIFSFTAQNLSTGYKNAANIAQYINFSLQNGDILWIKGRSGVGKSSLLSTLAGELPAISGKIFLNDEEFIFTKYSQQIAYLAQQIDIFDMTLAENLRLGKADASDEELFNVLEAVKLADWAKSQPLQLKTQLGEYATGVSGGQARRIALARFLLRDYPIMMLDEPFAGLDAASQKDISQYLEQKQKQGILLVVNHRENFFSKTKILEI